MRKQTGNVYWVQKGGRAGLGQTEFLGSHNEAGSRETSAVRAPVPAPPLTYLPPNMYTRLLNLGPKRTPESIIYLRRIWTSIWVLPSHNILRQSAQSFPSLANPPSKHGTSIPCVATDMEGMVIKGTDITQTSRNPLWNPSIIPRVV